ncbi:MAG: hypothetical protein HY668_00735 [Chloroflexi bacterium]|nr:hypothetical protein [Chloroflexota bacterium]
MPTNAAAAFGEEIGNLFEDAIIKGLSEDVKARGCVIEPRKMKNGTGNVYQIDAVVSDKDSNPLIIIDPKYIRYTKHNRDKGSWLCVAHYNLRKTFPTIRKSISILAGRWSKPSVELIKSFGVEVFEVPFPIFISALGKRGINFDWAENDRAASTESWESFCQLTETQKRQVMGEITSGLMSPLRQDVIQVLDTDVNTIPQRVTQVEILLKTDRNKMLLSTFHSVPQAIAHLAGLVADKPDISHGRFKRDRYG